MTNDDQPQDAPFPQASALESALDAAFYPSNTPPSSPTNGPESSKTTRIPAGDEPEQDHDNSVNEESEAPQEPDSSAIIPFLEEQAKASLSEHGKPVRFEAVEGKWIEPSKGTTTLTVEADGRLTDETGTQLFTSTMESQRGLRTTSVPQQVVEHARELNEPLSTEEAIRRDLPTGWRSRFAIALHQVAGNIALVCRSIKVSRTIVDREIEANPVFATWVKAARRDAGDLVEGALHVSATVGDLEPVYQGGVLVGTKRRKSVQAAVALLAAERPEYRTRGGDNSTTTNNQVNIAVSIATTLPEVQKLADEATGRLFRGADRVVEVDEVPELD